MKTKIYSFTWNGYIYCLDLSKAINKYHKEVFIPGKGWQREDCTNYEFSEAAKKYYSIFKQ
jgi:hypothetical protein